MKFYITSFGMMNNNKYKNYKCNFYNGYYFFHMNYDELINQNLYPYKDYNMKYWIGWKNSPTVWKFLESKHLFFKIKTITSNGMDFGINTFDLSEYDIMYMKLMDWII